jgi:hypothetical protein
MTVELGVDVELLKSEIKKTYSSVSHEPERDFIFPTGRAWAEDLGFPAELAAAAENGRRHPKQKRSSSRSPTHPSTS